LRPPPPTVDHSVPSRCSWAQAIPFLRCCGLLPPPTPRINPYGSNPHYKHLQRSPFFPLMSAIDQLSICHPFFLPSLPNSKTQSIPASYFDDARRPLRCFLCSGQHRPRALLAIPPSPPQTLHGDLLPSGDSYRRIGCALLNMAPPLSRVPLSSLDLINFLAQSSAKPPFGFSL